MATFDYDRLYIWIVTQLPLSQVGRPILATHWHHRLTANLKEVHHDITACAETLQVCRSAT